MTTTAVDDTSFWSLTEAIPDSTTPLRGFRIMTVRGKLRVVEGLRAVWPVNTMYAVCLADKASLKGLPWSQRKHTAPFSACRCGNYNAYTPDLETRMAFPWLFVTESVGQMFLGSHGFRAEQTTLIAGTPFYTENTWQKDPEPVNVTIERQASFLRTRGIRTYKDPEKLKRDYKPEPPPGIFLPTPEQCWDVE